MELGHELNVLLLLDIELFEMELITLELIACASVSLQSVICMRGNAILLFVMVHLIFCELELRREMNMILLQYSSEFICKFRSSLLL